MHRPTTTTRQTLLQRLGDLDDQASWREFDTQYRELILRYALRRGLQSADADDIRQVVMESLAGSLNRFEYKPGKGRFRHYLGTIVHHAISKHWSRQNRHSELLSEHGGESPLSHDTSDESWDHEWMLHHYRTALVTVREEYQPKSLEVFEGLMGGSSAAELARRHGLTLEAIYKIKQRIRDRLRELVARQLREEG